MARTKKTPKPTEPPAPAAELAAPLVAPPLDEPSDAEIATLVAELEETTAEPEPAPTPQRLLATVDQLLEIEQKIIDGRWVKWPLFDDAEILVSDAISALQEERRLLKLTADRLRAAAEKAGKSFDEKAELPQTEVITAQARARFNRSVKGWRGAAFAGREWSWEAFYRLWVSSIDFRLFVNVQSVQLRATVEQETAELGKACGRG